MAPLLFVLYLFLFSVLIARMQSFKHSGVAAPVLIGYFWLKVAAAAGYGYFHFLTQKGGDTWAYHRYSLEETSLLRNNPAKFISSIFQSGYDGYGGFLETKNSFWNDLDANTIPKLLAICNLFSGSNYYINVIFINFLFLLGTVLLFKAWKKQVPGMSAFLLYLPFLIPSFIFWTSGIHKEGFLVSAIALVMHALFAYPKNKANSAWRLLQIITGMGIMLALRSFLLLPTTVALASWVCVRKLRLSAPVSLAILLLAGCILFFSARVIIPEKNALKTLYERRIAFLKKEGNSKTDAINLQPAPASFIQHAPAAFAIGAFRPLPHDVYNLASGFAAVESIALIALLFTALYKFRTANWNDPLLLFCLYFAITLFFIIGYTIPFLGAVVRYRSIALPLWVMALVIIWKLPAARKEES